MESNLGKARDQDSCDWNGISWSQHMSRWFSISENVCWKCRHVLMALSIMKSGWRGIYSLHAKSNRYTQITKLGQTDLVQNVNVRIFGGTDMSTWWDRYG